MVKTHVDELMHLLRERDDRIRELEEQDAVHWKTRRHLVDENARLREFIKRELSVRALRDALEE